MNSVIFRRSAAAATLAAIAALGAALAAPAANAAPMSVSGTFTGSCQQQDPHPLDAAGPMLVAQLCKATNANPGGPLDAAAVAFSQIVVLDKGNGPQIGENAIIDKAGSITSEYRGTIKTTLVDGKPRTSGGGTYKMVHGTGIFAGGSGHGTYDLIFTSPTDFISHWKGEMQMPKRSASR